MTTPDKNTTSRFHLKVESIPMQARVCNAAVREPLSLPKWEPARRGADDFRRYKSRGF